MANLESHRATKLNITSSVSSNSSLSPSETSPTAHSFGFHDNYVPENIPNISSNNSSKRVLDLKRPPPLTLTPLSVPNTNTSPKVAQNITPLSATSITPSKLNYYQTGTSPKYGSGFKSELPSKVSPSHPYYTGMRQFGTNTSGSSKLSMNDSVPVFTSPTTGSSPGMHSGKKNFKPTLNLG